MVKLRKMGTSSRQAFETIEKANKMLQNVLITGKKSRCERCHKRLADEFKCADRAINGFTVGKSRKVNTFSSMPFSYISGTFSRSHPRLLCAKCTNDVYRFIGHIPEMHDSDIFPQVTTSLDLDDLKNGLKKKAKWTIHYKGKTYPHSIRLKRKLLTEAVFAYKKQHPETPHTVKQLFRLLNGWKAYENRYQVW